MLTIKSFTFNPFSENTYILSDETRQCIIVDPGCYTDAEKLQLTNYLTKNNLTPVKILLTHAHIDHILGNNFLTGKYNLQIQGSFIEKALLAAASAYGEMWGIQAEPSPQPVEDISEDVLIEFGDTQLKPIFTPGHSPGSFSFFHEESRSLIAGDVLFSGSIGRTDLPGGNYETLIASISNKLMVLSDDVKVFPGHGPATTIKAERDTNPFLNE